MKVFIIGIAGGIGQRLARRLVQRGDDVSGLVRRSGQQDELAATGIDATLGDLVTMTEEELAAAMRGSDAIVFSAGNGGKDDASMTERIDGGGVTKSISAAKAACIDRFYLVSVFPEAWRDRETSERFERYITVKKLADIALSESDLDWVILRPSALLNDVGTGKVSLGWAQFHDEIRRDDVADTLAELIHTPSISRVILEVTQGSDSIDSAVATMASRVC